MPATIIDISDGAAQRARGKATEASTAAEPRLYWRAIVRTGGSFGAGREGDRVEWHLAECQAPAGDGEHCNEGMHLVETVGHPDGHCMVDGRCGRCGEVARSAARKAA